MCLAENKGAVTVGETKIDRWHFDEHLCTFGLVKNKNKVFNHGKKTCRLNYLEFAYASFKNIRDNKIGQFCVLAVTKLLKVRPFLSE